MPDGGNRTTLFDAKARQAIANEPGVAVAWYLMASYAYFERDNPLLTDGFYDELCAILVASLEVGEDLVHWHANLLDVETLRLKTNPKGDFEDYPHRVKAAACQLLGLPQPYLV